MVGEEKTHYAVLFFVLVLKNCLRFKVRIFYNINGRKRISLKDALVCFCPANSRK